MCRRKDHKKNINFVILIPLKFICMYIYKINFFLLQENFIRLIGFLKFLLPFKGSPINNFFTCRNIFFFLSSRQTNLIKYDSMFYPTKYQPISRPSLIKLV